MQHFFRFERQFHACDRAFNLQPEHESYMFVTFGVWENSYDVLDQGYRQNFDKT